MINFRVGFGYDVHALAEGDILHLGGIEIPANFRAVAHSDGDVLIHALCDALLGAANLEDIGAHFPDNDAKYRNIDSKLLLAETMNLLAKENYEFGNADITVALEKPKLRPYISEMKRELADVMKCSKDQISIKATTTERLGFVGSSEGIAAYATVLINKKNKLENIL